MIFERYLAIRRSIPVVTIVVVVAAIVATSLGIGVGLPLHFLRSDPTIVLLPKLWVGHLAHFSVSHLFFDVSAILILGAWCEREYGSSRMFLGSLVAAPLLIFGLFLMDPELHGYGGLSGMACLYCAALGDRLRCYGGRSQVVGLCLLVALVGKILWEYLAPGESLFVSEWMTEVKPMPEAHLLGAFLGMGMGLINSAIYRHHRGACRCRARSNSANALL
jgi:hypothetical protein